MRELLALSGGTATAQPSAGFLFDNVTAGSARTARSSLSRLGLVRCYSSVAILPFSFQENPGGDLCRDLLCRNGLARIL
jgi:hypothetical protein